MLHAIIRKNHANCNSHMANSLILLTQIAKINFHHVFLIVTSLMRARTANLNTMHEIMCTAFMI